MFHYSSRDIYLNYFNVKEGGWKEDDSNQGGPNKRAEKRI
jgi:hypothetical protein